MHEAGSTSVRTTWDLLQSLHPFFFEKNSHQTPEHADQHQWGPATVKDADFSTKIMALQAAFRQNFIKQRVIDVHQFTTGGTTVEMLRRDMENLMDILERLIDPRVLQPEVDSDKSTPFPKLAAVRKLLQTRESNSMRDNNPDHANTVGVQYHASLSKSSPVPTHPNMGSRSRYSVASVERAASFIKFPKDVASIKSCRMAVDKFGLALDRFSYNTFEYRTMRFHQLEYTPHDVELIQHAHTFASSCTSLFSRLVGNLKCGAQHQIKLHMSGFKKDQLHIEISTCRGETRWVFAVFTRSLGHLSLNRFHFSGICLPEALYPDRPTVLHVTFNSEGVWVPDNSDKIDLPSPLDGEQSLDELLGHSGGLESKYRSLAGLLLAASTFRLGTSPWIEQAFALDCILVPPVDETNLEQWCPRVHYTLVSNNNNISQIDGIAALGVLFLELNTGLKAHWEAEDENVLSGERSNHLRLARLLKSWREHVCNDYRSVAEACLEFDTLVEDLPHPSSLSDKKRLAGIYSLILKPLNNLVVSRFRDFTPILEGLLDPRRFHATPASISYPAPGLALFDDGGSSSSSEQKYYASKFLDRLDNFFEMIKSVHPGRRDVANRSHDKVRIAVLDTGIDRLHQFFRGAEKRGSINAEKSKSFVESEEKWGQDSNGHGTHVTKLLLQAAPAAEIFVGRISTGKVISPDEIPVIAEAGAINWAVNIVHVDIISLSLGFEEPCEDVELALDHALAAGKLIFAAASNNGGLSGRARPARYDGVMCIHATDGLGNKGSMNPTPLPSKRNFATLGVAVPLYWKGNEVWKSGTSFAAPIAAGFAADILEFARHKCVLTEWKLARLHQKRGMEAIFCLMSTLRDGYDFVDPLRLWADFEDPDKEVLAARAIEDALGNC